MKMPTAVTSLCCQHSVGVFSRACVCACLCLYCDASRCVVCLLLFQASDQYLLEGLKRLCEAALAEVSQPCLQHLCVVSAAIDGLSCTALHCALAQPLQLQQSTQ